MCQILPENNENETCISKKKKELMCVYLSECYDFNTLFFRVREINLYHKTAECTVKYKVSMTLCQTMVTN